MQASLPPESKQNGDAQIEVSSVPTGAEIELDGAFVGSTPSTIGLTAGDHEIVVKKNGFKAWNRKIKVTSGNVIITAELEVEKD